MSDKDKERRRENQIDEWVKGNSYHNKIDNICCPDYSCCKPEFLQPVKVRREYKKADQEKRAVMDFNFMLTGVRKEYPKKVVEAAMNQSLEFKN